MANSRVIGRRQFSVLALVSEREFIKRTRRSNGALSFSRLESARSQIVCPQNSRLLAILFFTLFVLAPCTPDALADEAGAGVPLRRGYILHIDPAEPVVPIGAPLIGEFGLNFGVNSSPTGVILPDASSYFNLDNGENQLTYLTPRVQGLQLSMTGEVTDSSEPYGGDQDKRSSFSSRPSSLGANYSEGSKDFKLTFGGDYGRTPKSVPGAVRLVNDQKLLRLGSHVRMGAVTFGGAFGNDVTPDNLGEVLSWDVFGRYDLGDLAVGFVYNYTIDSGRSSTPGTLQGGISYFYTPRIVISANLAYGSYVNEGGREDSEVAGVLGFSFNF